ncbi:MAG: hypothetical protein LKJ25_06600 [Clostridia bacterium]|jgi:hypothetical protein|nr:hypothetical protein [Clostridia bacterium]
MKSRNCRKIKNIVNNFDSRDKVLIAISFAALSALFGASVRYKKRKIVSAVSAFLFIVSSMPIICDIAETVTAERNVYYFDDETLNEK